MGQPLTIGGDVIIAIDGEGVSRFDDILSYLSRRTEVGQDVQLTIIRDGKIETVTVTLGKRPSAS